jgi:hypothetical protein
MGEHATHELMETVWEMPVIVCAMGRSSRAASGFSSQIERDVTKSSVM